MTLVLLGGLVLSGCGVNNGNVDKEDTNIKEVEKKIVDNSDDEVKEEFKLIIGDKEYVLSYEDICGLENIERTVTHYTSKGETRVNDVKGVLLQSILEEQNLSKADYNSARFTAADGYAIDVPNDILNEKEIILANEFDKKPLEAGEKTFRLAIDEERSMYYVSNLVSVELFNKDESKEVVAEENKQIVLLESAYSKLETIEWKHYDESSLAINVSDLFEVYGVKDAGSVKFKATDDFEKTEEYDVVKSEVIKIDGVDSPLFTGENLPKGMQIKNMLSMEVGNTVFTSLKSVAQTMDMTTIGEFTGVNAWELVSSLSSNASMYTLVAVDGYEVPVKAEDLKNAVVVLEEDNTMTIRFDSSYPKNMTVKNLNTIKEAEENNNVDSNKETTKAEKESSEVVESKWEVTFEGLSDGTFVFTNENAQRKLEKVKLDTNRTKNEEKIAESWEGYKVSDILEFLGVNEFEKLTLIASDGYEITVSKEDLQKVESIIAVQKDGNALESKIQFVQDTEFANTWIKELTTIKVD